MFDSGLTPLGKTTSLSLLELMGEKREPREGLGKCKRMKKKLLFLVIVLLLNRKSQKSSDATTYTL